MRPTLTPNVAPKYRTAAILGLAASLLAADLVLVWLWLHPAVMGGPMPAEAVAADELAAQLEAANATLPRLAERLQTQRLQSPDKAFVAEYSASAALGAEPSMELSQLMAEGLAVVTVGGRKPVVMLGERTVRVGDTLPDGSRVSGIDRHGLTTQSPQGGTGRLQGFGAISAAASAPEGGATDSSTKEGAQ
jgi:hypothetical protein